MLNYHFSNQSKILLIRLSCLLLEYCLKCLLRSVEYTWELLQYLAAVWRAHTFISPLYQGPHQIKSPMIFYTYGFLCCRSVWPERGLQGIAGNVFRVKSNGAPGKMRGLTIWTAFAMTPLLLQVDIMQWLANLSSSFLTMSASGFQIFFFEKKSWLETLILQSFSWT